LIPILEEVECFRKERVYKVYSPRIKKLIRKLLGIDDYKLFDVLTVDMFIVLLAYLLDSNDLILKWKNGDIWIVLLGLGRKDVK